MGKTIRGARKGKNSIFTAHTRLRKGPVRLRKIDYAEKCAGRVPLSQLFDRPIGATAARQIPVLKVTCSNHVSVIHERVSTVRSPRSSTSVARSAIKTLI